MANEHAKRWWGTPIYVRVMGDTDALNQGLRDAIIAAATEQEGMDLSNMGGWHSELDLLRWPVPEIAGLKQIIASGLSEMYAEMATEPLTGLSLDLVAWANVSRRGDYNRLHTHPGSHWSGCYYVDPGAPDPERPHSGMLQFIDPRPAAAGETLPGMASGWDQLVRPKAGMIVLFPAWLQHAVLPYTGEGERISIAFNVRIG